MKEVKHYICEICGTEFDNEGKCRACENGHIKPVKFKGWSYYASRVPKVIIIEFDDGNEYVYSRVGDE